MPEQKPWPKGFVVTDIDMRVDRATKEVTSLAIENKIVTRDVPKEAG